MLVKTEGIVLHSLKYGERRVIVDIFTREQGRLSFIVPVPRSERSKIKKQYLQPLTLLQLECDVRPQQQLQKLRDASLLQPLPSLLSDPKKLTICLFVSEFLYHALKGEQQNTPLFDYVRSSIEWLDGCQDTFANFHLVFLMRTARFLGFFPNLEEEGDYFDLRGATFCSAPPLHRDFLLPQEAGRIRLLMRMDYPTMHLFRLSRLERGRILEILLLYYRLHLPAFPELRSVAVLQELYR
ncbi:MAG: DNA repair protein RecO [Prevotella sp.]|nr:DNA repair protein RecO [Prevotella sp.]